MGAILISVQEYRRRRQEAARRLGDGVLILKADSAPHTPPPHRSPDKYLHYLAGFVEPQSAFVMQIRGGKIACEILFCLPRDERAEQWDGERAGPVRARRQTGIENSDDIAALDSHLDSFFQESEVAHFIPGADAKLDSYLCETAALRRRKNRGGGPSLRILSDASATLDEMRAIKSPAEIALLHRAMAITASGHCAAMRATMRGAKTECEVEAVVGATFRVADARHSFLPIVAAGQNALTLHYQNNNGRVSERNLILVDAGAEFAGYAGDMSRTFPASGKFSPSQSALYDVVLFAQKRAVAAIRPGAKWDAAENAAARAISRGLAELKICKGDAKTIFAKKLYRKFYMHRVGHFIGMDVHDVGRMTERNGGSRVLRSGMVLTVEPGLYIPDAPDIPRAFRNIGIRIEDVVVVRRGGCEILPSAPKTRAEIEKWMRD